MKGIKNTTIAEIAFVGVSALFIMTFLLINFMGFEQTATSDVYADTLFAMEAWDSKSIFPDGWVFGNQYYVIATPVLCALIYAVTGSINFSMAAASAVMTVLLLWSLVYMLRPVTSRLQKIAALAVLLGGVTTVCHSPQSLEWQLLFVHASYYSCYMIAVFVPMGDYIRALREPSRTLYNPATVISCLLLFACGMQSIRQTVILILPLAAFEFLRLAAILVRDKRLKKRHFYITARVGLYALFNLAGLVLIRLLDIPNFVIKEFALRSISQWPAAHNYNMTVLGKITGFFYAANEPDGWRYLIPALIFTGITLYTLVRGAVVFFKTKHADALFLIQIFLVIGLIMMFAANIFMEMGFRPRYVFLWYALIAVSAALLFKSLSGMLWNILLAALLIVGCGFNWYVSYAPILKTSLEPEKTVYEEIADYISDNDYRYLYGDWPVSTTVALHTDGDVRAYCWNGTTLEILSYLNSQNKYGEQENARAVYLFKSSEEPFAVQYASERGAVLTKVADFANGAYILYTCDTPLMHSAE